MHVLTKPWLLQVIQFGTEKWGLEFYDHTLYLDLKEQNKTKENRARESQTKLVALFSFHNLYSYNHYLCFVAYSVFSSLVWFNNNHYFLSIQINAERLKHLKLLHIMITCFYLFSSISLFFSFIFLSSIRIYNHVLLSLIIDFLKRRKITFLGRKRNKCDNNFP